jgi:hypothetical protein
LFSHDDGDNRSNSDIELRVMGGERFFHRFSINFVRKFC